MPPKVDFYILHFQKELEKERFICRLTDKAWHQDYRIYIHADSTGQAKIFDDMLWTFRQDSFLPHALYTPEDKVTPVQIGHMPDHFCQGMDVLVSLTETVPDFYHHFERVAEFVDANNRKTGRERYRFYRDQECELNSHDIYP